MARHLHVAVGVLVLLAVAILSFQSVSADPRGSALVPLKQSRQLSSIIPAQGRPSQVIRSGVLNVCSTAETSKTDASLCE
jgi:hypothetical protein